MSHARKFLRERKRMNGHLFTRSPYVKIYVHVNKTLKFIIQFVETRKHRTNLVNKHMTGVAADAEIISELNFQQK